MMLKCKCGFSWDYHGGKKKYAVCPDCRKIVRITEYQAAWDAARDAAWDAARQGNTRKTREMR